MYVFPLSSEVPYPSRDNITGIMALSIAFTVLYMIGIPSYLFYLIRKAVGEVDRNLGTERLYDEIKEVKAKKAEGWEKLAQQLEDDAKKKYQEAVNAYQQAASTLYSSYERNFRYYKIIVLVEKLILIMVDLHFCLHEPSSRISNEYYLFRSIFLIFRRSICSFQMLSWSNISRILSIKICKVSRYKSF